MSKNNMIPVSVNVRKFSRRYADEFLKLKCSADLLTRNLFPDFKEITESFAAFNATQRYLSDYDFADPNVTVICVADGHTPRTGAVFAFRSRWKVISIDPVLRIEKSWGIDRLTCLKEKIEDVPFLYQDYNFGKVLIVGVHPHVGLQTTLNSIKATQRALIWLPCCYKEPYFRNNPPNWSYQDWGIWSQKNWVKIWKQV